MNLAESSLSTPFPPSYTAVKIDVRLKRATQTPAAVAVVPVRIVGISKGILIIRSAEAHVADSQVEVILSSRPLQGMVRGCAADDDGFTLVVEVPERDAA